VLFLLICGDGCFGVAECKFCEVLHRSVPGSFVELAVQPFEKTSVIYVLFGYFPHRRQLLIKEGSLSNQEVPAASGRAKRGIAGKNHSVAFAGDLSRMPKFVSEGKKAIYVGKTDR